MGLFNYCCVKISVPPPSPALPRAQYPKQYALPFLTKQLFAILGNTLQSSVERTAASATIPQLWEDISHIQTHSCHVSAHEELLQLVARRKHWKHLAEQGPFAGCPKGAKPALTVRGCSVACWHTPRWAHVHQPACLQHRGCTVTCNRGGGQGVIQTDTEIHRESRSNKIVRWESRNEYSAFLGKKKSKQHTECRNYFVIIIIYIFGI